MGKPETMFRPAPSGVENAFGQCEILSGLIVHQVNVETLSVATENSSDSQPRLVKATPIVHPYAIVVSQDCDLTQDHNYRHNGIGKPRHTISNILFCEAMNADDLVYGDEHGNVFQKGAIRQDYRNNNDFRFHFIQEIPKDFDNLGCGLPELGFVFKRFFTVPSQEAYDQIKLGHALRRTILNRPYSDHFCSRFYHYNNRIALPEQYEST